MKTLSLLLCCMAIFATSQKSQAQSDVNQAAKAFLPEGWTILSTASGDLNGDGTADMAALIRKPAGATYSASMLIMFRDANGKVTLHCNSDKAVEDQNPATGPTYQVNAIRIKKGILSFGYSYALNKAEITDTIRYKFINNDLRFVSAFQKAYIDNYYYEVNNDVVNGKVTISRWPDMSYKKPKVSTMERKLPEPPSICTYDIGMFSRVMNALSQPEENTPEPPPAQVRDGMTMPTDGLYAYLDFNNDEGDRSSENRKTTTIGGQHVFDGYANQVGAFELDGKSYVQIMTTGQKFNAPFTISAWFNSKGNKELQTVLSMGRTPGGSGFNFGYNVPGKNNAVYLSLMGNAPFGVEYEMENTGWHFACATVDEKQIKLYIDGALVVTKPVSPNDWKAFVKNMQNSNQPIEVGRELATLDRYFTGTIDNVTLYRRALSDDEVNALWNSAMPSTK